MAEIILNNERKLSIQVLKKDIVRISVFKDIQGSALNRYGFLKNRWERVKKTVNESHTDISVETTAAKVNLDKKDLKISISNKEGILLTGRIDTQSYHQIEFDISKGERFFGLGDQTRERIEHYGTSADMWIKNVVSYIPIPFLMSDRGYGIFVNTTFRHYWDIGKSKENKLRIIIPKGNLDIYLFISDDLKEILSLYTEVTGRPCLPPKWSFGLWFISNMYGDVFEVMSDALNFRDRKIPCDVIGLEPNWMENFYDYTIEKRWHPEKFPIPSYAPNGPHTFISALKRMGYKLELWLCNDYDLSYEAERRVGKDNLMKREGGENFYLEDDKEKDVHFTEPVRLDKITKPEEPWFEHLKKFIDQGVDFFKQDGALQVCEHPDRRWGNGMTDDEMHNLYPLLYSQQMYEGFKEYTGRRPCCFTPAGWAGLQRYTGTWTGDTGGEEKTLVACLNLSLSGHSLVTCDMEVTTKEGIHYGFLLPWAQVNSWNYFRHPWLLGDKLFNVFQEYANLRSQLIPYIYTYAYYAHKFGVPVIRPLVLEYPDDRKAHKILHQYFLGRELLVTAFKKEIYLPEGKWVDFWTGKIYKGSIEFVYQCPENRGGGLFIRDNSIVPLGPVRQYVEEETDKGFTLFLFLEPGNKASFCLYDDDGITFGYEKGVFNIYSILAEYSRNGKLDIIIPSEKLKIEKIFLSSTVEPVSSLLNGKEIQIVYRKG